MLVLLLVLQVAAPDSLPQVTLAQALERAAHLDPNYVSALGQVDNAVWARRSAFSVFIVPAVTLQADATQTNPAGFNFLTLTREPNQVMFSWDWRSPPPGSAGPELSR